MTHPGALPLTLTADVLRLPYPAATRLVLAEVLSLHEATRGCCDCSDQHLADRLTLSKDTVSRAIHQLEADQLLTKAVDKAAGFYRTLVPDVSAIVNKASTNPYPQNAARATRKMPPAYPQNAARPSRILPPPLAAKCGTNTTYNTTKNLQELFSPPAAASEPAFEAFWQAFGKKQDTEKCRKRWLILTPAEQAAALAAVPAYVAATPDKKFRKNPLTWLNGRCWQDEELPSPASIPISSARTSVLPPARASSIPTATPFPR